MRCRSGHLLRARWIGDARHKDSGGVLNVLSGTDTGKVLRLALSYRRSASNAAKKTADAVVEVESKKATTVNSTRA